MFKKIKQITPLILFGLMFFFAGAERTLAVPVFSQIPINEANDGPVLNSPYPVIFGCTVGLNCGVSGQTIYNIGIWMKKVGNPLDVRLQVVDTWQLPTTSESNFSTSIPANTISDTAYTLKWFYFPTGVVIGSQYDFNQFFQLQFTQGNNTYDPINHYQVLYNPHNDYSAPQQWCKIYLGCWSSTFFWIMDDEPIDLSLPTACVTDCYSNVLFLPGLQASRLYRQGILQGQGEDQLWEPTRNEDVEQLYLSSTTGESLNSGIYTRDIIDESPQIINGYNIYKSFVRFMDEEMVGAGIINAWEAIPYDWRLDYDDILTSGRKTGDNISYLEATSTPYILQELRQLAETSKTGKVTIIAHSNGGLLAKTLIEKLKEENNPLLGKIDKLILVAVPQLGTPKAIEGLLHGDETQIGAKDFGFFLDEERGRELGESMQSAYNLLPSEKYLNITQSPVIEFSPDVAEIYDFPSLYGTAITTLENLKKFLLGDNGLRTEPSASDEDTPNVLKEHFLNKAVETQSTIFDSWAPPPGLEVIQIAGWGVKTLRGIKYDDCDIVFCADTLNTIDRQIFFTHKGDGTVVLPSAISTVEAEKFYVNIKDHNSYLQKNRDHASILEINSLQIFVKNLIQGNKTLLNDIYESEPLLESGDIALSFRLHSPVAIHLYDTSGNHTGLIPNPLPNSDLRAYEARLPNSYYHEFGETKYAGVDGSAATTKLLLIGEALGTFTLEIEETLGDNVLASAVFADIPVIASSTITADIQSLSTAPVLAMDIDNDGVTDLNLTSGDGVSPQELLKILKGIIKTLDISDKVKKKLVKSMDKLQKQLEKEDNETDRKKQRTNKAFDYAIKRIEQMQKKNILSMEETEQLRGVVETIRVGMVE